MMNLQTKHELPMDSYSYETVPNSTRASSPSSPYLVSPSSESAGAFPLEIALIGPDWGRRAEAAAVLAGCTTGTVRQYDSYPVRTDELTSLIEQQFDVIAIDLDSNPEQALRLVENICAGTTATVMVYSSCTDPELLMRCMRAGAREYLTLPFEQNTLAEALARVAARLPQTRPEKKPGGRLLVFMGAKGGTGVTTLACNFAVALAQGSGQSTLLLDLDLPLGDAALNLGIVPEFSAMNALQEIDRLDSSFLSKLLVKHSSGVSVLSAPGKFPYAAPPDAAIDKLLALARQEFENVVVDAGARLDMSGTSLLREATRVYLITQAGIPELRNSNRLIAQFFSAGQTKLEVVLNRYEAHTVGVTEEHITKALTRPAQWKLPNDHALVRRNQINATPLVLGDSNLAKMIRQMAGVVTGKIEEQPKKKGFRLFG